MLSIEQEVFVLLCFTKCLCLRWGVLVDCPSCHQTAVRRGESARWRWPDSCQCFLREISGESLKTEAVFFFFLKLSWPRNSNVKQLTSLFIAWKHENTQIIKRLNVGNWMPAPPPPTEPSKIGKPQFLSLCFDFLSLCAILLSLVWCWTPVCAITHTLTGIPEFPSWS